MLFATNPLRLLLRGFVAKSMLQRPSLRWLSLAAKVAHFSTATDRAVIHTVRRHGGPVQDVVVLELSIPRSWLRRSRRGLWYSTRDIPPVCIRDVVDFANLSRSPVEAA
jgi:hypothetical protein